MRSDVEIKRDTEEHLRWDPAVDATDIAVTVQEGVIALSGFVQSYAQKREAERDAKRVAGVLGIANDIAVRLLEADSRSDPQIARDAVSALRSRIPFTSERLKVIVKEGWLTIEGTVEWGYVSERGLLAVEQIRGLKGVTTLITLQPSVTTARIVENLGKQLSTGEPLAARLRFWAERPGAPGVKPPGLSDRASDPD